MEIHFVDLDRRVPAATGQTVLDACEAAGIDLVAACGGFAACNSCRVRVVDGVLSPIDEIELPFLDEPGQRLGCQARIVADVALRMEPGC